ncbi:hypothetical protein GC194_00530 [bacterium]|nr:hypothetical protein [bacterium]
MILASIPQTQVDMLGNIRHWPHVMLGSDHDLYWLKGLSDSDIQAPVIRKIPGLVAYSEQQGWLMHYGSKLRQRRMPDVLFSPIARALPVEMGGYNHHFFGLQDNIFVQLVRAETACETAAQLVDLQLLLQYVRHNPVFRFRHLQWTILGQKALVLGHPPLPLPGEVFWQQEAFLFPPGWQPQLPLLLPLVKKKLLGSDSGFIIVTPTQQLLIKQTWCKALSRSSVQKTLETMKKAV